MSRKILFFLSVAGIVLLVSGCAFTRPVEDTARFYVLQTERGGGDVAEASPAAMSDAVSVGLRRVRVADYVNTPAMVVRTGENSVRYSRNHRWAEGLDRGTARLLRETMRGHPAIAAVYLFPETGRERIDFEVEIDLLAFEAVVADDGTGRTNFRAYWKIYDDDGSVIERSGDFVRRGAWEAGDFSGLAGAAGEATAALGREIAEALADLAAAR